MHLSVSGRGGEDLRIVQGQQDVELLGLDLSNPGVEGLTDNIRVGQLTFSVTDTL